MILQWNPLLSAGLSLTALGFVLLTLGVFA
jgi:hypothetical protein